MASGNKVRVFFYGCVNFNFSSPLFRWYQIQWKYCKFDSLKAFICVYLFSDCILLQRFKMLKRLEYKDWNDNRKRWSKFWNLSNVLTYDIIHSRMNLNKKISSFWYRVFIGIKSMQRFWINCGKYKKVIIDVICNNNSFYALRKMARLAC